jgi:hypothetical protein
MDRRIWFSRRALGLHALIVVVVPTFIALCIWQLHRALGGNQLSWAYVFEWPFFAGYAVYMWWRFLHETPRTDIPAPEPVPQAAAEKELKVRVPDVPPSALMTADAAGSDTAVRSETANGSVPAVTAVPADQTDPALSGSGEDPEEAERQAYNRYLADLAARDQPKQWR